MYTNTPSTHISTYKLVQKYTYTHKYTHIGEWTIEYKDENKQKRINIYAYINSTELNILTVFSVRSVVTRLYFNILQKSLKFSNFTFLVQSR